MPEHYYHTAMEGLVNAKKVQFVPVPGHGHFIAVEAPELMCQLIDEFLKDFD